MKKILLLAAFLCLFNSSKSQDLELLKDAASVSQLINIDKMLDNVIKVTEVLPYSTSALNKVMIDRIRIEGDVSEFLNSLSRYKNISDIKVLTDNILEATMIWLGEKYTIYICVIPDTTEVYALYAMAQADLLSFAQIRDASKRIQTVMSEMFLTDSPTASFDNMLESSFGELNINYINYAQIYMCNTGLIAISAVPDVIKKGVNHSVVCFINEAPFQKKDK